MVELRSRTVRALLVGVLLVTTACRGEGEREAAGTPKSVDVAHINAPEVIALDGVTVQLTHETGLTYTVPILDGIASPPVLWDGDWVLETDTGDRQVIRVGESADRYTLQKCLQIDDTSGAANVRCIQALMTETAIEYGYSTGEKELMDTIRNNQGDTRWGRYCHVSAMTLAATAVLAGDDPRRIMDEHESPCEYSTYHGAAAAAVMLAGDDARHVVETVCTPNPANNAVPFSQGTQCWHGVGIGLAYLHRFDPEPGLDTCMLAPDTAWTGNCIEGLFAAQREYQKRLDGTQWQTETTGTPQRCHDLYQRLRYPQLSDTCYRDVGQRLTFKQAAISPEEFTTELQAELRDFANVCQESLDSDEHWACWNGIAVQLAVGYFVTRDDRRDEVVQMITLCDESGTNSDIDKCYARMALALFQTPQKPGGLPLPELLDLLPPERRTAVSAEVDDWMADHYGVGT